jgi:hypothetical protein
VAVVIIAALGLMACSSDNTPTSPTEASAATPSTQTHGLPPASPSASATTHTRSETYNWVGTVTVEGTEVKLTSPPDSDRAGSARVYGLGPLPNVMAVVVNGKGYAPVPDGIRTTKLPRMWFMRSDWLEVLDVAQPEAITLCVKRAEGKTGE